MEPIRVALSPTVTPSVSAKSALISISPGFAGYEPSRTPSYRGLRFIFDNSGMPSLKSFTLLSSGIGYMIQCPRGDEGCLQPMQTLLTRLIHARK